MRYINILSLLVACLIMFVSCSEKSNPVKSDAVLNKPSIGDDIPSNVATEVFDKAPITTKNAPEIGKPDEDCHGKRVITQSLEEVEASILKIGDKYVISTNNGNSRYNPCDLPTKLKQDGMLVRFSGEVLEIFPNERLMATPFRLRNIVERDR